MNVKLNIWSKHEEVENSSFKCHCHSILKTSFAILYLRWQSTIENLFLWNSKWFMGSSGISYTDIPVAEDRKCFFK